MPNPVVKGLRKAGPSNEVEQELADEFNKILASDRINHNPRNWGMSKSRPIVPASLYPPNFSDEEAPWEFLNRVVPTTRGLTPFMHFGPNEYVLDRLHDSGFEPHQYGRVNLLGTTNVDDKEITLNPSMGRPPDNKYYLDQTVAHEMAHAAGLGDEGRRMGNIEGLMMMARDYQRRGGK